MLMDFLRNKIVAAFIFAAAGAAAVSLVYHTLPPEDHVYRVAILHGDETTHIENPRRVNDKPDLLCHMRVAANRECRYKSGGGALYIRGDARNPGGLSVVTSGVWDDPSQDLTHALIEDLEAGFVFLSPPMWRGKGGWKYHLTMKRLTPEEVAELESSDGLKARREGKDKADKSR